MKIKVNQLLKNKKVLYIVLFFTLMNIFGYLLLGDINAILFFVGAGLVTTYFTKNMILVMLSAMLLTNLFAVITNKKINEGYDHGNRLDDIKDMEGDIKDMEGDIKDMEGKLKLEAFKEGIMSDCLANGNCSDGFSRVNKKNSKEDIVYENVKGVNQRNAYKEVTNVKKEPVKKERVKKEKNKLLENVLGTNKDLNDLDKDIGDIENKQMLAMQSIEKLAPLMNVANDMLKRLENLKEKQTPAKMPKL